uniref:Protein transport protein SEC31 homolog B n=1 Tax=Rhizophora mucronata TaxID=61149 RepID=A0A2P2MNQ7_RHIMU
MDISGPLSLAVITGISALGLGRLLKKSSPSSATNWTGSLFTSYPTLAAAVSSSRTALMSSDRLSCKSYFCSTGTLKPR